MVTLKKYQEEAVNKLINLYKVLPSGESLLLHAPTGSGKTIMMGTFMERLVRNYSNLAFIWLSIGKSGLHEQSAIKIGNNHSVLSIFMVDDVIYSNKLSLDSGDVLALNWEAINSKNKKTGEWLNIFMRTGDNMNLEKLVANTAQEGVNCILIIDEAHTNNSTPRYGEIISLINPLAIVNVTATPRKKMLQACKDRTVTICSEDVIKEGVIKKSLIVNKGIQLKGDTITSIIDTAIRRREQLKKLYEKEESHVNPLCLIQLPNGDIGGSLLHTIQQYLATKNITTDNNRLAIWLTTDKINTDVISKIDAPQEYLIFKQAIDTGWDCPRAQILVKLRDIKSEVFQAQVMGRILRMPELKHYRNEVLNSAYVFTDEDNFELDKPKDIPELNIFTEQIPLQEKYKDMAPYILVPTFPYFQLKPFTENKQIMIKFADYLYEKIPIFLDNYKGNEKDFTSFIPRDVVYDVVEDRITAHNTKQVRWSTSLLRLLTLKLIKSVIADDKLASSIFDYILNRKPEEVIMQYYLEAINFNITYILDKLAEIKHLYTLAPTVELADLKLVMQSMPMQVSVKEVYYDNPSYEKLLYTNYPYKTLSKTDKAIIEEFEKDDSVIWWCYNRTHSGCLGLPYLHDEQVAWYKPRFIANKGGKVIVVDYTKDEENYKILTKMFELWKELAKLPVYDFDLRFL